MRGEEVVGGNLEEEEQGFLVAIANFGRESNISERLDELYKCSLGLFPLFVSCQLEFGEGQRL